MEEELLEVGLWSSPGHDPTAFQAGIDEIDLSFATPTESSKETTQSNPDRYQEELNMTVGSLEEQLVGKGMTKIVDMTDAARNQRPVEPEPAAPLKYVEDFEPADALTSIPQSNINGQAMARPAPVDPSSSEAGLMAPESTNATISDSSDRVRSAVAAALPPPEGPLQTSDTFSLTPGPPSSTGRSSLIAEMRIEESEAEGDAITTMSNSLEASSGGGLPAQAKRRLFDSSGSDPTLQHSVPVHGEGAFNQSSKDVKVARIRHTPVVEADIELETSAVEAKSTKIDSAPSNQEVLPRLETEIREFISGGIDMQGRERQDHDFHRTSSPDPSNKRQKRSKSEAKANEENQLQKCRRSRPKGAVPAPPTKRKQPARKAKTEDTGSPDPLQSNGYHENTTEDTLIYDASREESTFMKFESKPAGTTVSLEDHSVLEGDHGMVEDDASPPVLKHPVQAPERHATKHRAIQSMKADLAYGGEDMASNTQTAEDSPADEAIHIANTTAESKAPQEMVVPVPQRKTQPAIGRRELQELTGGRTRKRPAGKTRAQKQVVRNLRPR